MVIINHWLLAPGIECITLYLYLEQTKLLMLQISLCQSQDWLTDYFKHNLANKKAPAGEFATVVKAL